MYILDEPSRYVFVVQLEMWNNLTTLCCTRYAPSGALKSTVLVNSKDKWDSQYFHFLLITFPGQHSTITLCLVHCIQWHWSIRFICSFTFSYNHGGLIFETASLWPLVHYRKYSTALIICGQIICGVRLSLICNYIFLNHSQVLYWVQLGSSLPFKIYSEQHTVCICCFYIQIYVSSYFACMDGNFSKVQFALTVFFYFPGPCFPQLPQITGTLLCM
jgi:hypothetical protein